MKKIILMAFFTIAFMNINAEVTYYREHGFLRHYDYVQQTNFNNGSIVMYCSNPGWQRCRPMNISAAITYHGSDTPMSEVDYENIDNYIEGSISETNTSGSFIFAEKLYVRYNYDVKKDLLSTTLYTLEEAKDLHFIQ